MTRKAAPVTTCIVASGTPVAGVLNCRQGSARRDHGEQGGCDEEGAHPPAGTRNGQCEQAGADGEREKRGEGDQEDADLGHEGTRDHEGHVRLLGDRGRS
ncbi:MAG: hypothetical protein ABWY81_06720 [Jiangellaceae bacterium]